MSGCGAAEEANDLMPVLLGEVTFDVPDPDMESPEFELPALGSIGEPVTKLTNDDLTTGQIDGQGTFDALMRGFKAHLKHEFENNRITGEQYARAYVELTASAMGNAVQYLLGRDQAYWQAVTSQLQAQAAQAAVVTARVQLETAKVQLQSVRAEALLQQSAYALAKLKLASEDLNYCVLKYNLEQMLPTQKQMLLEQIETQRAQTLDTRTDGLPVTGQVGKQIDLYDQQITSYKRDSENKTAKMFVDAWITMKTIDEGLLPPDAFTNLSLDEILDKLKANNDLVAVI